VAATAAPRRAEAAQARKLWDSPGRCLPLLNWRVSAALPYLISISVKQRESILGAQGSEGLIAGRGWVNAAVALCSRLAAWRGCSALRSPFGL